MGLARPYRVLLVEKTTGILLNFDGSWYDKTSGPSPAALFDSLEEALTLKGRLLAHFPAEEIVITEGPEGFSPTVFGNGPGYPRKSASKRSA